MTPYIIGFIVGILVSAAILFVMSLMVISSDCDDYIDENWEEKE